MSYFTTAAPATTGLVDTYSSAFPPLQIFPLWTICKKRHHINSPVITSPNSTTPPVCFTAAPLALPKYADYLKHTGYAKLAIDQYNDLKQKITNNMDLRLPQYWYKPRHSDNGYNLTYSTIVSSTSSVSAKPPQAEDTVIARTNFPIKPQCGIYYFEIRVLQKGQDGHFAVGFCTLASIKSENNKLPGCDFHSYGYHGHTGQFYQKAQGTSYGPTFSSGDIIGCGINFANKSAFFTKNGVSLGVACHISDDLLYPCMGLSTPGEKIAANFGQEPFAFDINQYVKDEQTSQMKNICKQQEPITDVKEKFEKDIKADLDQLVLSYLLQQGYSQTAKSLFSNIQHVKRPQEKPQEYRLSIDDYNRNAIRKALMAGHVDQAVDQIRILYPDLLEKNHDLLFQLKTRKFLEILIDSSRTLVYDHSSCSDTDDDTMSSCSGGNRSRTQSLSSSTHDLHNQILYEEDHQDHVTKPSTVNHQVQATPLPVADSGRRLSWAAIAASPTPPSFDTPAIEDIFANNRRKSTSKFTSRKRRDSFSSFEDEEKMSTIRKAMSYGHSLQEEYQGNSKYLIKLMELFKLLAYSDPKTSPMAHLLDLSHRDTIASELNNIILIYQKESEISKLELIYKQSLVTNHELLVSGNGQASLFHFPDHFKH